MLLVQQMDLPFTQIQMKLQEMKQHHLLLNNYEENNRRPSLKVYKQPNMNVLVFEPTNFNDTRIAADALKASKAVLINYEKIEQSEQVRICDFMNGACYVLDGSVKRISAKMVLYVPNGVSIEEIIPTK